jgi:hypothetical protein
VRLCVEARDLLAGDHIANQSEITAVHHDGDETTITLKPYGEQKRLWSGDHVWIDRAAVAS